LTLRGASGIMRANQMVSQPAGLHGSSRERLLAAAAREFAARGFDGAKVDRIAALARVNKAMLYYHFTNKAALYRAILIDLFQALTASLGRACDAGGPPEAQLRRFVRAISDEMDARPHFPAIWLREMAEGGRHLDVRIIRELTTILGLLKGILDAGRDAGVFGDAHPLVVQVGIVAPLLFFKASAPIRERFQRELPGGATSVDREAVMAHVETGTLAALASRRSSSRRPRS
jgi:AcrR family transcriptional regulator